MPKTVVKVDLSESPYKNERIHNRWHPDVPIIEWVKPGDDFIIETYDWTGGRIQNTTAAGHLRDRHPTTRESPTRAPRRQRPEPGGPAAGRSPHPRPEPH